jgi:hypothetical protein
MVAVETEAPPATAPRSADAIPIKLRRTGGTARQVFALTLVGTLALAVFASRDLSTWTERFGNGPFAETVHNLAAQWDGAMERLGLTRPHDALRLAIRRLLDWEWGVPP